MKHRLPLIHSQTIGDETREPVGSGDVDERIQ